MEVAVLMDNIISGPELRSAIRFALRAPSPNDDKPAIAITSVSDNGSPGPSSPAFRALIDGILYSRRFILSYHVVIACLVLGFTVVHWGTKARRLYKRRRTVEEHRSDSLDYSTKDALKRDEYTIGREDDNSGGSSSSSSTLRGTASPPHALKPHGPSDEQSPLLSKSRNTDQPIHKAWLANRTRAWLIYQPLPIPVVNKVLPSNAATLVVLALCAVNIFYTLYNVPFSLPLLFIFADRASLVFVANLPLLYLFAAKNQPIKFLTGYSYESLNILHRRLGEILCLLALLHSLGMIGVWYTLLRPTGFGLARFLFSKIILLGIGAVVCYESLYLTSLGWFRQRWYELFLGLHIVLQVVALVLLWFHHHNSRVYVGIALAIFLVDRLVYRMTLKVKTIRASLRVEDDQETVGVCIDTPLSTNKRTLRAIFGSNISNGWKATEHVFLTVPALSRKHIIQAHPFTIASKPPAVNANEASLELIIRAQDGFSGDLLKYAKGHDTVSVRLDGPYGSQTAVESLQNSDISVIVAGGSGIAVAWPLVWSVLDAQRSRDLEHQIQSSSQKRILFVWIVHKQSHLGWISQEKLNELQAQGVDTVTPPPTAENGRPDIRSIVDSWVSACDESLYGGRGKIGVVCSGPDGMNREVRNTCSGLAQKGRNIHVDIEKFGW